MKKFINIFLVTVVTVFVLTACGRSQELKEDKEEQLVFEKATTIQIPKIREEDGSEVFLGIFNERNYFTNEDEEPLFLYTYGRWDEAFKIEGSNHWIVKVDRFLLEITPYVGVCPVWNMTSYSGDLIGKTNNCYIFRNGGNVVAVENCNATEGITHSWDDLPSSEKKSEVKVTKGNLSIPRYVQVNSWLWPGELNVETIEDGVYVSFLEATVSIPEAIRVKDPEWFQSRDGRMFFIQKSHSWEPMEAVFIGAVNGCFQIMKIPFTGEFLRAEAEGIFYSRNGETYFKSFYPIIENNKYDFPEMPVVVFTYGEFDFPEEVWNGDFGDSIPAEMVAPF